MKLDIDQNTYYMYRSADLYKFFDGNKNLLFVSSRSQELAERLKDYKNLTIVKDSYTNIKQVLKDLGIEKITGGILFDLVFNGS